MKRLLCIILLCAALLLAGCSLSRERILEPVTFYYLRTDIEYGSEESVIASELREASGHRDNLSYLLSLYQMGPSAEGLRSPLAPGVRIRSVERDGEKISLTLVGDASEAMTDVEFTLACACLSKTCLELTDAEAVAVTSGPRTITMNRENLVLYDSATSSAAEGAS